MYYNGCGCVYPATSGGCRSGLAIVLVLFILLAIIICPTFSHKEC